MATQPQPKANFLFSVLYTPAPGAKAAVVDYILNQFGCAGEDLDLIHDEGTPSFLDVYMGPNNTTRLRSLSCLDLSKYPILLHDLTPMSDLRYLRLSDSVLDSYTRLPLQIVIENRASVT